MTDTASPEIDAEGWLAGVRRVASPNCDARPPGEAVRLVVIHAISLPPGKFGGDAIERLFTNRLDADEHPYFRGIADIRVSAHFLVRRDGSLTQFVPTIMRAWHAGVSCWHGREHCNDFSLGIELEGDEARPFEEAQYDRLIRLLRLLAQRFPVDAVVGHCDVAPGRKTDPGPCFDWRRVAAASAS